MVNPDRGGNNTVPASNVELISAIEMKRAYYHNHRSSGQLGVDKILRVCKQQISHV